MILVPAGRSPVRESPDNLKGTGQHPASALGQLP